MMADHINSWDCACSSCAGWRAEQSEETAMDERSAWAVLEAAGITQTRKEYIEVPKEFLGHPADIPKDVDDAARYLINHHGYYMRFLPEQKII